MYVAINFYKFNNPWQNYNNIYASVESVLNDPPFCVMCSFICHNVKGKNVKYLILNVAFLNDESFDFIC